MFKTFVKDIFPYLNVGAKEESGGSSPGGLEFMTNAYDGYTTADSDNAPTVVGGEVTSWPSINGLLSDFSISSVADADYDDSTFAIPVVWANGRFTSGNLPSPNIPGASMIVGKIRSGETFYMRIMGTGGVGAEGVYILPTANGNFLRWEKGVGGDAEGTTDAVDRSIPFAIMVTISTGTNRPVFFMNGSKLNGTVFNGMEEPVSIPDRIGTTGIFNEFDFSDFMLYDFIPTDEQAEAWTLEAYNRIAGL